MGTIGTIDPELAEEASKAISEFFDSLAEFLEDHEVLAYIVDEYEIQEELIKKEMYPTVLMRQSTFFESFLTSSLQFEIEDRLGQDMSHKEKQILTYLGLEKKVHLAYWFEVISDKQREALLELMSTRNDVAHQPWISVQKDDNKNIERVVRRIHSHMENLAEDDWEVFD